MKKPKSLPNETNKFISNDVKFSYFLVSFCFHLKLLKIFCDILVLILILIIISLKITYINVVYLKLQCMNLVECTVC